MSDDEYKEESKDDNVDELADLLNENKITEKVVNKGTGAGGANTNVTGKSFENKTNNDNNLIKKGFEKVMIPGKKKNKDGYYLIKKINDDEDIVYVKQHGLKFYFQYKFKIVMFRNPDEAYLYRNGDKYTLKIIEMKNQNVAGSVDTKLLAGPGFIEEYNYAINNDKFKVEYSFCISEYLKKNYISEVKKYDILRKILNKHNIKVFYGDDENYFDKVNEWLNL